MDIQQNMSPRTSFVGGTFFVKTAQSAEFKQTTTAKQLCGCATSSMQNNIMLLSQRRLDWNKDNFG